MNEGVVDNNIVINPDRVPAPSSPAIPAAAQKGDNRNARTEEENGSMRRKIPTRIGVVNGRTPDPNRIVDRHVQHFRVGGNNLYDGRAALGSCDHLLFWC